MKRGIAAFLVVCMALQTPISSLTSYGGEGNGLLQVLKKGTNKGVLQEIYSDREATASDEKKELLASASGSGMRYDRENGMLRIAIRNFLGIEDSSFNIRLECQTSQKQLLLCYCFPNLCENSHPDLLEYPRSLPSFYLAPE